MDQETKDRLFEYLTERQAKCQSEEAHRAMEDVYQFLMQLVN